jgi:hypothetical protein
MHLTFESSVLFLTRVAVVCGAIAAVCPARAIAHETAVSDENGSTPKGYVPPLVSNGNISLQVDYEGCQFQQTYARLTPCIFWAGRRFEPPKAPLVSFGHFEQDLSVDGKACKRPTHWQQSLDTDAGLVRCRCDYDDVLSVETTAFVPLDQDFVVVHKRLVPRRPGVGSARVAFKYQFSPDKENVPPRRVAMGTPKASETGIEIPYQFDGYQFCDGVIQLLADRPVTAQIDRQIFCLSADLAMEGRKPAEITFYLVLADSMDGKTFRQRAARMKAIIEAKGFARLLADHQHQWARYWAESFVRLPVERMEKAYYTAQYHLRINTTKWSMPIALLNTHWAGLFFAWDESFVCLGLASSNHLAMSQRVPDFRYATLPVAVQRTAHRSGKYGARYVWEATETGGEGTSPGFWLEHVFHMGNIALSCWYQYLYTGDVAYLKAKSYPVIKECATFFEKQMIYEVAEGKFIFGKCTDLERLGPAKLNPFLTSCSAIFTLEAASKAAKALNLDDELAGRWTFLARKLRESLPNDGQRYIPYSGCEDVSIGTLGGLFPYALFGPENSLQKNAAYKFVGEGAKAGNMYPVGERICAWYGGWMACAMNALGDRHQPARLLGEVADGTGHFTEMFEINEQKVIMRPWFSTAEGNYVYGVNQMLLDSGDDQIRVAPTVPDAWKDFAFRLPAYGGTLVTVVVKDGQITELTLTPSDARASVKRTVVVPQRLIDPKAVNSAKVTGTAVREGAVWLEVTGQGPVAVLKGK